MNKKILIVEDEDIIRNALKKLLRKNHFDVSEAASIDEAKKFSFDDYDLLISDLRLPGGQGTDLIELAGQTPVLIMTSYASMRSAVDAMKLGAVDYIAKPFDHKEMIETVQNILGIQATKSANKEEANSNQEAAQKSKSPDVKSSKESLDDYFIRFVKENEPHMSETALAKQLGISRKNLWERRQKLGIPRKK